MTETKAVLFFIKGMLKEALTSARIWTGYILALIPLLPVLTYLKYANHRPIQVCEAFIVFQGNYPLFFVSFIGLFVIVSEAPFLNARTETVIHRMSRTSWGSAMMLYLALQTILYTTWIAFICITVSIPKAYWGDIWSWTFLKSTQFMGESRSSYPFFIPPNSDLMNEYSPWQCFIFSFILISFYSYILSLLIFILNFKFSRITGIVTTVCLHLVSFAGARGGFHLPLRWTPGSMANVHLLVQGYSYGVTFGYALIFFILSLLILCILIRLVVKHSDFRFETPLYN